MSSSVIARSELKKNSSTEEKSRNYSVHHNTVWEMWKIKGTWIGSVIARQNKSIQTERIFYLIYTQSSPFDLPGTVAKIANFAKAMVLAGYGIPCNNVVFNIFKHLFQVLFQSWPLSKEEKQSFVICSLFNFFSSWKPENKQKNFRQKNWAFNCSNGENLNWTALKSILIYCQLLLTIYLELWAD